ncbi:MAG TPA: L,D-transpeptidase [Acidimicrobiales bacterium]|jgi:lipoprotein-anchoring transpeptidase ErfK/SrfK|nr:L,D-transpeptidase [Acidimicrobiales bacterium]
MITRIRTPLRLSLAALALALASAACSGSSTPSGPAAPDPASPNAPATASEAAARDPLVARADADVAVFAQPGDAAPSQTLPATTGFGSPRALLVEAVDGDWLEVLLPTRPNGSTGWIRRADVELRRVDEAIEIDLASHALRLVVDDEVVVTASAAIGTTDNPTPTGRFYVVDKLATGDPANPYGPFALGLSGHSDVLTEFAGGDGQVGIHGTNDPSSIGQAVSHGCVRVPNEVITQLSDLVPLGTPVVIS